MDASGRLIECFDIFDAGELNSSYLFSSLSLFHFIFHHSMASIVKYRFRQYFYYPRSTLIMFDIAASVLTNSDDAMSSCAMPINFYYTIRLRRTFLLWNEKSWFFSLIKINSLKLYFSNISNEIRCHCAIFCTCVKMVHANYFAESTPSTEGNLLN